jgi:hypothetical protein
MLRKKITEPRRVVSLFDPALRHASAEARAKYTLSRDLIDLGDVDTWPERPTFWLLGPLRPEHAHLTDGSASYLRQRMIVSLYLLSVENWSHELQFETIDGVRSVLFDDIDRMGSDVVADLAGVIAGLARSDTTPFSPPAGYSEYLRTDAIRRAMTAPSARDAN